MSSYYGSNEQCYTETVSSEDERSNSYDFTSKVVGHFGKWQLTISILMSLLKFPCAWFQMEIIFLAPPQDFWCEKPEEFSNYSNVEWWEICSPKYQDHNCLIYDPDILVLFPDIDRRLIPLVQCPKFIYDDSVFNRTIISEWDLVCSRHWLVHLSQCVMMWGVLTGGVLFGALADKYGRKNQLMICILIQSLTSFVSSLMPSYWGFLGIRFLLALASGGIGVISFVMCVEVVDGKWRTTVPVLYHLPFGLGTTIMAGIAYWLRDWRKFEFCLACLSSLYLLYWFWIPESPRWLLAKGRINTAVEVLKKAASTNRMEGNFKMAIKSLPKVDKNPTKVPGFTAFIKSKNMRYKTLLLSGNWLCTGLSFYSFSQYLGSIGANIFLTVAMTGIISMPGGIACVIIITKVGRKRTIAGFQLLTALCFLLILITPKDTYVNDWPLLLFTGLGLAGMAGAVPTLYLFSGELFPTLGRNVGLGGVTTFARIGSMLAPIVVALDNLRADLPLILLAAMSFLQITLLLPLPETKDCPLPDTIEQAENFNGKVYEKHGKKKTRLQKNTSSSKLIQYEINP